MKQIVIILALMLLPGCAMQPGDQPLSATEREFAKVYEVPILNRQQLYDGARRWLAEHSKSDKAVIEYQSPNDGVVIGNGAINYPCSGMECVGKGAWTVKYTVKIETKDGRFRVEYKNLMLDIPAVQNAFANLQPMTVPLATRADLDAVKPRLLAMGDELRDHLAAPPASW